MRMRAHIYAFASVIIHWPHMIEEHPRAYLSPLAYRQQPPYRKATQILIQWVYHPLNGRTRLGAGIAWLFQIVHDVAHRSPFCNGTLSAGPDEPKSELNLTLFPCARLVCEVIPRNGRDWWRRRDSVPHLGAKKADQATCENPAKIPLKILTIRPLHHDRAPAKF